MTSLDGINGRSIQTLLRGENDSKQSDEFQAKSSTSKEFYNLLLKNSIDTYIHVFYLESYTINSVSTNSTNSEFHGCSTGGGGGGGGNKMQ